MQLEPFISTERSFLEHFVQCSKSLVFKYQRVPHFYPENLRSAFGTKGKFILDPIMKLAFYSDLNAHA